MSYAQQYDDRPGEWFWENPPDAKEGDEIYNPNIGWMPMPKREIDMFNNMESITKTSWMDWKRRRLIQAGEGWRICHLDERPIATMLGGAEFTTDGITWCHFLNGANLSVRQLVKKNGDEQEVTGTIIAIRVPIVVQAGHNNMIPTLDPHIQAVIDAARVLKQQLDKDCVPGYPLPSAVEQSPFFKARVALETALAALGEQPQTRTGLPKPGEAFLVRYSNGKIVVYSYGIANAANLIEMFTLGGTVTAWFPLADIKWIKVEDVKENDNHDTTDFPQQPCRQCGKKDRPQYDGTCNDDHCSH